MTKEKILRWIGKNEDGLILCVKCVIALFVCTWLFIQIIELIKMLK